MAGIAFGLDLAILIGVAVSILLFVPRAAKLKASELILDSYNVIRERLAADAPDDGFLIYDLEGELFFGAAPELSRHLALVEREAKARGLDHVLLRLKRVRHPDAVSLEAFEHFIRQIQSEGIKVWLSGVQPDLIHAFQRLHFFDWFQTNRLFPSKYDDNSSTFEAIKHIRAELPVPQRARIATASLSNQAYVKYGERKISPRLSERHRTALIYTDPKL